MRFSAALTLSLLMLAATNLGCQSMSCGSSSCGDCTASCGCPEPACGCDDVANCGCPEASCGCDDSCCGDECCGGCDDVCCGSGCKKKRCKLLSGLMNCFGCGCCAGCDCELYWSEWHNDPPCKCDPCDCYGNYTGPQGGYYAAPYRRQHPLVENSAEPSPQRLEKRRHDVAEIPAPPVY